MENFLTLSLIIITACVFYAFGNNRGRKKRRRTIRTSDYGTYSSRGFTRQDGEISQEHKRAQAETEAKNEPFFCCAAIAEGYANMATGGAFAKSRKQEDRVK